MPCISSLNINSKRLLLDCLPTNLSDVKFRLTFKIHFNKHVTDLKSIHTHTLMLH